MSEAQQMAAKPLTAAQQAVIDRINAEQAAAKKADVPLPKPVLQSTGLAGGSPDAQSNYGVQVTPQPQQPTQYTDSSIYKPAVESGTPVPQQPTQVTVQTPLELGQPNSPTEAKATQPKTASPEQVQVAALAVLEKQGLVVAKVQPVRIGDMSPAGLVTYDFIGNVNKLNATDKTLMENAGFTFTQVANPPTPSGFKPTTGVGVVGSEADYVINLESVLGAPEIVAGNLESEAAAAKKAGNNFTAGIKFAGAMAISASEVFGLALIAPEVLPSVLGISSAGLVGAAALGGAFGEVTSLVTTGKSLSRRDLTSQALFGEGFAVVGNAALLGVGGAGDIGRSIVSSSIGRAGVNAALGGGAGYALSGGDVKAGVEGALFGAALSLGMEHLGVPLYEETRARLPKGLGGVERLNLGEPVEGSAGQTDTYVGNPSERLGGKSLRLVADVTMNPVGVNDVELTDMVREYVGGKSATAHATLNPSSFDLKAGGETLLRGFPSEAGGFRSSAELYHFYSAPGGEDFVNVYGGYIGVGESLSGSNAKLSFGGKPTVLATLDTPISSEFLPAVGESESAFLARTSKISGVTGIAQETILGKSVERQFVTPASYSRGGEELPGSLFVSEGDVGSYQVKQLPKGGIGEVPVLRSIFSKYTDFNVVLGRYESVTGAPVGGAEVDVGAYNAELGKTLSLPSTVIAPVSGFGLSLGSPSVHAASVGRGVVSPISMSKVSQPHVASIPTLSAPNPQSSPSRVKMSTASASTSPLSMVSSSSRMSLSNSILKASQSPSSVPKSPSPIRVSQSSSSVPRSTQPSRFSSVSKSIISSPYTSTMSKPPSPSRSMGHPPPPSPPKSPSVSRAPTPPRSSHHDIIKPTMPQKRKSKPVDDLGLYQRRRDLVSVPGLKKFKIRGLRL